MRPDNYREHRLSYRAIVSRELRNNHNYFCQPQPNFVTSSLNQTYLIMSRNYKFRDPNAAYFVSFAVVNWLDVFTRIRYKNILVDSLHYCQEQKGMEIFAWCIMTNHVHLVFRCLDSFKPQYVLGDFKRFTSKKIVQSIQENSGESRKQNLLDSFAKAADKTSNVKDFMFWRHDNRPIQLWSKDVIAQKINYLHQNPVAAGIVEKPEHYLYSSAKDYTGEQGLVRNVIVLK